MEGKILRSAQFEKYKTKVDDEIRDGRFEFYSTVSQTYRKRLLQVASVYEGYLSKPLDLNAQGRIETDYEKRVYPADTNALIQEWKDFLRFNLVSSVSIDLEIQNKAKEKKDTVIKIKSVGDLEASAREKILKNNKDYFKRLLETSEEDMFADYLNAIARLYARRRSGIAARNAGQCCLSNRRRRLSGSLCRLFPRL